MSGRAGAHGLEPRWLPLAAGLVIAAAVLAAYANSLSVPFVFDDGPSIADNPTIRRLWPIGPALSPPAGGLTVSGRPVLNLSLAVNYAIGGTSVWSYHAFNLAIHLLAALTLFGIVRRTPPRSTWLAGGAALLWAVHPLQTEAVVYVVQRAESLMGLFYLLTLYCFIRGTEVADGVDAGERPRHRPRQLGRPFMGEPTGSGWLADRINHEMVRLRGWFRRWGWFVLSVAACLLGMGTKEVMVSAPVMALCYDRTFLAGTFRRAWRLRWRVYLGLAATWIPLGLLVASTGGDRGGTSGFDVGVAWWAYGLTQFEAVVRYLALAAWPHPLVFEYGPFWVTRAAEVVPDALIVIALAVATGWALLRPTKWGFGGQALGFAGAWFFAILAPTSLVPGTLQMIVEHRMYLPLAAVTVAVAAAVWAWLGTRGGAILALALAAALGAATFRRNEDYHTELRLWSDTVAKRPDNPYAQYGLGVALAREGRAPEAMAHYSTAIRLKPNYPDARLNLGNLLFAAGWVREAIAQFEAAIRLRPGSPQEHNNYANALAAAGRPAEAIAEFQHALWLRANYPEAEYNLGNILAGSGRLDEAIAHYQNALRLNPAYAEAHANLGVALARSDRLDEAIGQFREALRLKPDYPEELNNLGNAMAQAGRLVDALAAYEGAVRLRPGYAEAHNGLGSVLMQAGRNPEAEVEFEEALHARPDYAKARENLARVRAQLSAAAGK